MSLSFNFKKGGITEPLLAKTFPYLTTLYLILFLPLIKFAEVKVYPQQVLWRHINLMGKLLCQSTML